MSTDTTQQTSERHSDSANADVSHQAAEALQHAGERFVAEPAKDLFGVLRDYAHDRPDVAAVWSFGLGLIIGWKLRG